MVLKPGWYTENEDVFYLIEHKEDYKIPYGVGESVVVNVYRGYFLDKPGKIEDICLLDDFTKKVSKKKIERLKGESL